MNRRTAAGVMTAMLFGSAATAASAQSNDQAAILTHLIDEVIAAGNMDNLDHIVSPEITIASLGVLNIDEFRDASIEGYESRSMQYDAVAFTIESMAENEDWCHALVRFEGKKVSGGMEARSLFYVARFRDGLISQLYLG